jgi:ribosomal protein S18 acetylase RimI-like enzyme
MSVVSFEQRHLKPLLELVNLHLSAALPGACVSADVLAAHLERNVGEYIVDPWVLERTTLCVPDGYRLAAAVHLLRYADRPEASPDWRAIGEIGWLVFRAGCENAAAELLATAREQFATWHVRDEHGWGAGLPDVSICGVPDAWPHIDAALRAAGYAPDPNVHREALFGGWLADIPAPGAPPLTGLTLARTAGPHGTRFAATLDNKQVGFCEFSQTSAGWAEGWELHVHENFRRRGLGTWLVRHAVAWLRLAGCERIVLSVTEDDEQAGAGAFYRAFGWDVLTRQVNGWRRE